MAKNLVVYLSVAWFCEFTQIARVDLTGLYL